MKQIIVPPSGLPSAPYSPAVRWGDVLYVAGQVGADPRTGRVSGEDIRSQTRQVLENLKAVVEAAGATLADVVKTTCYLKNIEEFGSFNEIYAEYFPTERPARATIQATLVKPYIVEIEAIVGLSG